MKGYFPIALNLTVLVMVDTALSLVFAFTVQTAVDTTTLASTGRWLISRAICCPGSIEPLDGTIVKDEEDFQVKSAGILKRTLVNKACAFYPFLFRSTPSDLLPVVLQHDRVSFRLIERAKAKVELGRNRHTWGEKM